MKLHLKDSRAWEGVWTALITPLRGSAKSPSLDTRGLEDLLERQLKAGIHGFVIAGSTGEGSLLNANDYSLLLKKSRAIVGQRAFVVAGLGIGGTRSCLANLEIATRAKCDGVLASPPAYIKTPDRLLADHYLSLARGRLPVCLYEIPGRAASSMSVDFLTKLVKLPAAKKIVALKDATGSLSRISEESEKLGRRLALLSGDDGSFAAFMKNGGHGVISVATHFLAESFLKIWRNSRDKKFLECERLQEQMRDFVEALFWESNPIPCKSLAAELGWIRRDLFSRPLGPMDPEKLQRLKTLYQSTREGLAT